MKESNKKLINISNKNSKVLDILSKIDRNKQSDYICQAILEKYERDKNPIPDNIDEIIEKVIIKVMGNKPLPVEEKIEIKKPIPENEADNKSLILDMFSSWDE